MPNQQGLFQQLHSLIGESVQAIRDRQDSLLEVTGKLVRLPETGEALILGDLHGDLETFRRILRETKFIEKVEDGRRLFLVCLGDYIDRGPGQVELMKELLELLVSYPGNVVLLRGNHEGPRDLEVRPHDFPDVLRSKLGGEWRSVYESFRELFDELYTACVLDERALLLHGGIPSNAESLDEVAWAHRAHPESGHLAEILWNDPSTLPGVNYSFRGTGKLVGEDVSCGFLDRVGVDVLVRGHECFEEGFHFHGNRVLTLFSCKLPVYRNGYAAYLRVPLNEAFNRETLQLGIHRV